MPWPGIGRTEACVAVVKIRDVLCGFSLLIAKLVRASGNIVVRQATVVSCPSAIPVATMDLSLSTFKVKAASAAMASSKHRSLPLFVETAGNTLFGSFPLPPPFSFEGVTMMIFPLRANIARLTEFCDSYLNINAKKNVGDQLDVFKPAAPFVFMIVLKYGKMASSASQAARNMGWIAQHEVTFTVPLEWWRWTGAKTGEGELKFQDWAIVSPFIFVDDFLSQNTGREVYGWPKVAGNLCADLDASIRYPSSEAKVLRFSTYTQPKFSRGKLTSKNLLLEIDADPDPAFASFPPQLSSPWMPWNIAAQVASTSFATLGTVLDYGLALGLRGYPRQQNRASFLLDSSRVAVRYASEAVSGAVDPLWWLRSLTSGRPESATPSSSAQTSSLTVQSITVKQFPDIERPHLACYQALVRSGTSIRRVNRAGLLGDLSLLRSDLSGGYTVRIHQSALHPIVESLGIDVHRTDATPSGNRSYVLKPLLPYWCDVDTTYEAGHVLYSQILPAAAQKPKNSTHTDPAVREENADDDQRYFYNSIIGIAATPVSGPFHIPDMLIRVYPLRACPKKLGHYIQGLNGIELKDNHANLELRLLDLKGNQIPPGPTTEDSNSPSPTRDVGVFLLYKGVDPSHGEIWADELSPDWLTDKSVEILIPVKLLDLVNGDSSRVLFISPYAFNNSARATISDFEVNGRPTQKAVISDSYNDPKGEMVYREYVHTDVSLESFADLGEGQRASLNTLLEIDSVAEEIRKQTAPPEYSNEVVAPPLGTDSVPAHSEPTDAEIRSLLRAEPDAYSPSDVPGQSNARACLKIPLNLLGLKQYRDAEDPFRSCYQSVVLRNSLYEIRDWAPIERTVRIRIHHSDCYPIVDMLGLGDPNSAVYSSQSQGLLHELEPLFPFWVRVKATESLGAIIARRNIAVVRDQRPGVQPEASSEPRPCWMDINLKQIKSNPNQPDFEFLDYYRRFQGCIASKNEANR